MKKEKVALVIPSEISKKGAAKVKRELSANKVDVLAKTDHLLFVRWNKTTNTAMSRGPSIQDYFVGAISPDKIRRLPSDAARIALVWNWSIAAHSRKVTEASVMAFLKKLDLEVRNNQVYDKLSRKYVGKVKEKEESTDKSNWTLRQTRYSTFYPSPFYGGVVRYRCKTRTYESSALEDRLTVDYILAEVDSDWGHYDSEYKYNASQAFASDSAWWWGWMGLGAECYSYARKGRSSVSLTGRVS
jgi:hypothetical protein